MLDKFVQFIIVPTGGFFEHMNQLPNAVNNGMAVDNPGTSQLLK
jgi:hypothetical protein